MPPKDCSKDAFLQQLSSINLRSREFPNILAKMLATQAGEETAMSLQGEDALTLVNILDQAFEAPNMPLGLREKSVRLLRRVCGLRTILPRSCILSDSISKEGHVAFASGGFADVWKGRHRGNAVCIKAFRAYTAENLSKIKQRLFQEIVIWRRLSHQNILPVLGVSSKLFPLCVVSEWMIDGNIMEFLSNHPEVQPLRLLAEAASGLQYLHSMEIIHGDIKPTNILIDGYFHPRLTDYGLAAMITDPNTVDPGSTTSPSDGTVRYMAPELLNPAGFGLSVSNPSKKSDIYALGVTTYEVVTGQQPFAGAKDGVIIYCVVSGERPGRPPRLPDDVWNFICRCWSASWDNRPDVDFAVTALNDVAGVIGFRRKTHATNTREALQPSPPQVASTAPSPFIAKRPAGSKAPEKERKRLRQKGFRTWHDSSGVHRQEAALVGYKDGVVHLSSSDGAGIEISEDRLCQEDITYIRSQDIYYEKARPKLSSFLGKLYIWKAFKNK